MKNNQEQRREDTEKYAVSIVGISVGLMLVMCMVMMLIKLVH